MRWLEAKIQTDQDLTEEEALSVLQIPDDKLDELLDCSSEVRQKRFGNTVRLCSIINAKSGSCSEDCFFCAQSSHHQTEVESYPLLPDSEILNAYRAATDLQVTNFSTVTSGKSLTIEELNRICELIKSRRGKAAGPNWCASLGMLGREQLRQLKKAGLKRFHHNLETAESYFHNICTTHSYSDRLETIRAAKLEGLEVCCGGIFALGEGIEHRVELAFALKELKVDTIPLNFLIPIPNTPAVRFNVPLSAESIIKTIAMFRLVCREAEIKIGAGREHHIGDLEEKIFRAGATGMTIGGYLTVKGRSVEDDLLMIRDAGMNL